MDRPRADHADLDAAIRAEYGPPGAARRIAEKFSVTKNVVIGRAGRMGLAAKSTGRKFTAADDHLLRNKCKVETAAAIARRLGRTASSVQSRAQTLGITIFRKNG